MNFKKSLMSALSVFLIGGMLSGCDKGESNNLLKIVVLNAGYGDAWIKDLEAKFEATHEGIDVDVTAIYEANNLIEKNLGSKKNDDDLYISVGANWKSYAAQGKFLDLTSFLEEEVDGMKVKDKVTDEYSNSLLFTKSSGDKVCYRLPWTSGIGGIYYNKVLFEENKWEIPTTFEELLELCNTINNARIPVANSPTEAVKPFAYTGANTDYFDYTVYDWWGQIVGVDAIKEFLKYDNANKFDATSNPTYAALRTATSYWQKLFVAENGGESNYVIADSDAKTAEAAQKEFANGYAAMMFNGDWIYNEITNYGISNAKFKLGLMKTPKIKEANEAYVNTSYVIGEDQYIAIPSTSDKVDLAKEFIKLIISDEGCKTFTTKANGFLAYKTDYSKHGITNEFIQEVISLRDSYTSKFTNYSADRKYLCNFIDIWCTPASRPFLSLLNNTNTLDAAFLNIASTAKANWSEWENKSK